MPRANIKRAQLVEAAIRAYDSDDNDRGCLTDMLADAMHWCELHNEDFHCILAQARRHFINEIRESQLAQRRLS